MSTRDAFLRAMSLNYLLLLLMSLPLMAPVIAHGADVTAHSIVDMASAPRYPMGRLTLPCAYEDGTGTPLPCYWDARTQGNRDVGALTAAFGLTGYVLYPGVDPESGDPVACNETTDRTFICENGLEWEK